MVILTRFLFDHKCIIEMETDKKISMYKILMLAPVKITFNLIDIIFSDVICLYFKIERIISNSKNWHTLYTDFTGMHQKFEYMTIYYFLKSRLYEI